jgi:hypothetical protein
MRLLNEDFLLVDPDLLSLEVTADCFDVGVARD